jgi:hypothetical protein
MKSHKIVNNSTDADAGEEISTDLESLDFLEKNEVSLTEKTTQILLNESSTQFLVTSKVKH